MTLADARRPILSRRKNYNTDKLDHGYLPYYKHHFRELFCQDVTVLEIGIANGGSLRMWRDWFPHAQVIGVDIQPEYMFTENRIRTICGDAGNPDFWARFEMPENLGVVIDDGSHIAREISVAFHGLCLNLMHGGFYVIEDLGTQRYKEWEGHLEEGSTITNDLLKTAMWQASHGEHWDEMHVYNEIAFLRRG